MNHEEAAEKYGKIENGVWSNESKWMMMLDCPIWFPKKHIYCNKDLSKPLQLALNLVEEANLQHEIKTFDGCFCIRYKRGSENIPSVHSYGLAIDLNASDMPLNFPNLWSIPFVKCFYEAGFEWGGNWKRLDCQHVQLAGLW